MACFNIPLPIKTCRTTHRPPKCLSPKHAAFFVTASACPCSLPWEKRLRLTSQLPAAKTLNSPHNHHRHQASFPFNTLPDIPCTTPPSTHPPTPPPPPPSSPPLTARARLPRLATEKRCRNADIPADRSRFYPTYCAFKSHTLSRRAALVQNRHKLKK